ncbi:exodeoxyribonuclease [Onthophagus taurus]|uniref:exodeoxyribonuclease n=1 Tax=Onthophagus taurus TaxID=166361 RepID=UPI000C2024AD|nr:uncharacterized protein LOC111427947 [Onthophagus taurus]
MLSIRLNLILIPARFSPVRFNSLTFLSPTKMPPRKRILKDTQPEEKEKPTENEPTKRGSKRKATKPNKIVKENNQPKYELIETKESNAVDEEPKNDSDKDIIDDQPSKKLKKSNLKISSWNVDGLRAWIKKKGLEFIAKENPDIFCIQETRCSEKKLPDEVRSIDGYKAYWFSAVKEGYSGVGIYTKTNPQSFKNGFGVKEFDDEGRCITLEYDDFYLVNVYVPNAGRGLITLDKRLSWNEEFKSYIKDLDQKKPVIVCGDMNVAHNEIDLANPKSNKKSAGFTIEEREGMTDFLSEGFLDTYRKLYPDKTGVYTFWSYMNNARAKNVGWRLDYFIVSNRFMENVADNIVNNEFLGSDHCPITLLLNT